MEKLVLFLQPDQLTCYRMEKGAASVARQWPIAASDLPDSLALFLDDNIHAQFSLLIDTPEEECHLESFKTTSLRDRSHLINRLKSKHFKSALLSKASVIGKGNNASLLLSGVASDELCTKFIRMLEQSRVCLRAVHSPLTLMSAIAKASHAGKGACLFILPMRGCYRLTACVNSFVLFNRRIVLPGISGNEFGVNSQPAIENAELTHSLTASLTETLVYLQRQQAVGWKTPRLIVVGEHDSPIVFADVCKNIAESGLAEPEMVESAPAVSGATISGAVESGTASEVSEYRPCVPHRNASTEGLLVTAAGHCGNGYATRQHRQTYTTRKVRNVCAALALCSIGGVVSSVAVANKLTDRNATIVDSYHATPIFTPALSSLPYSLPSPVSSKGSSGRQSKVDTKVDTIAADDYEVEAVRQALVTAKLIELGSLHNPIGFLGDLAQKANTQQSVSVTSVKWQADDVLNEDSLTDMIARPEAIKALDVEQVYQATVSGIVHGKPDVALRSFEKFVSALRTASSDPSVVVVETPFGLGSGDKTTDAVLSGAQGDFVLELSSHGVAR